MVSKLLSIWRPLSLLFFLVGGLLIWQSIPRFQDAAAATKPVAARKALEAAGTTALEDTLVFDLSEAGLGQDNFMGWKGKEYAVIPAHPVGDSTRTLLVLSTLPTHLGPLVNSFLSHQSASVDGQNLEVRSSSKDPGNAKPEARALIQKLGEQFKDNLNDSVRRRELVRGVGHLRKAEEFPQIDARGEILAVREGYLPEIGDALAFAFGGVLLIAGNASLWFLDRRRRREQDELEAAELPEAPLV